jgi:hypothetical protein
MPSRKERRRLAKVNRELGARSRDLPQQPVAPPTVTSSPFSGIDNARIKASPANTPGIVQGTGADWLGPLNPMQPTAPKEVEGRQWDFPVGYNLEIQPRAYEPIGFHTLRALAENLDLLRLAIETRKDQLAKMPWGIKPKMLLDGSAATKDDDPVIEEITDFFRAGARIPGTISRVKNWGTWSRMIVEDMLVLDAASLYCNRTYGGKLLSLDPTDGSTIKPVIDDWGDTPSPPVPAYQQVLKGFPAVDLTTDDLIYAPRNIRTHKVYGYGPVEQVIMTANIAMRRELFQLDWYTEGTQPEGIIGTPKEWTQKQIADFQNAWDAQLAGNSGARRRMKFVPGEVGKTYVALKEPDLTGKTDEWLIRVICYAFSLSPQAFISMMNRATAETAHDAALQEGLVPLQTWLKDLIDDVIVRFWPKAKVEFQWSDDRQVDPVAQETVISGYVKAGIISINEGRDQLGLDPDPEGNELRCLIATGYTKVGLSDDAPTAGEAADAKATQATQAAAAMHAAGAAAAAKPGEPAPGAPKPAPKSKGAPATKSLGSFRGAVRKTYWAAPRHVPQQQGGS